MLKPGIHDYFGSYIVERFVDETMEIENKMKYYLDNENFPLNLTKEDEEKFCRATRCWQCNQFFTPLTCVVKNNGKVLGKVRDYCIVTCKNTGAAHNGCNINETQPNFISIKIHNLSRYDRHLF